MISRPPFLVERDRALIELDTEWARKYFGLTAFNDDETCLVILHKARYETQSIAPELRKASRQWLEEHNYHRFFGMPWPNTASGLP